MHHAHCNVHSGVYTPSVYLAQGDSGTDTETNRQVISALQTIPRVKSDHQWNTTASSYRLRSSWVQVLE